jgi:hypothetical protein
MRPAASAALALVGLITGAGLVVYFLTGVSLPLALLTIGVLFASSAGAVLCHLPIAQQREFVRRVRVGALAGALATGAYDATRVTVVALGLDINPFAALPRFGELLLGTSSTVATVAGAGYHLVNGIGFAVAFTIVAGEHGPVAGVVWALALETLMLTFYPGWLDIRAMREFVSVSMSGHVAYGLCLGYLSRRLLHAPGARAPARR